MLSPALRRILVCPICQGELRVAPGAIVCRSCEREFPQSDDDWVDLLPSELAMPDETAWPERQAECDAWYVDLIRRPDAARACFHRDYRPYAHLLTSLAGRVLDLGGGAGMTASYLQRAHSYVVLEPSRMWTAPTWRELVERTGAQLRPLYVRGVGESPPFRSGVFDAVLSFWSLNHVRDPEAVIANAGRILRSRGVFLLVLEDMEPRWRDLLRNSFIRRGPLELMRIVRQKVAAATGRVPYPLQPDHLRLTEREIRRWTAQRFKPGDRAWPDRYLMLLLRRR